jgi:hypothetical protein
MSKVYCRTLVSPHRGCCISAWWAGTKSLLSLRQWFVAFSFFSRRIVALPGPGYTFHSLGINGDSNKSIVASVVASSKSCLHDNALDMSLHFRPPCSLRRPVPQTLVWHLSEHPRTFANMVSMLHQHPSADDSTLSMYMRSHSATCHPWFSIPIGYAYDSWNIDCCCKLHSSMDQPSFRYMFCIIGIRICTAKVIH